MKATIEQVEATIELMTAFKNELVKAKAEPQLTTPPGIRFLTSKHGTVTGMYFNDGKQCLSYCELTGQFEVHAVYRSQEDKLWTKSECLSLTPCKYEDLKPGDFVYSDSWSNTERASNISMYHLCLPDNKRAHYNKEICSITFGNQIENWHFWKIGK